MSTIHDQETRRFRVTDVMRMIEVGLLGEDEPLELLDGRLVVVSPQGSIHRYVVGTLYDVLADAYRGAAHVSEEKPIVAGEWNLPEPDLAVVPGIRRDWLDRHPDGAEVWLVVEVAQTSQKVDRAKVQTYSAAGVPEYWFVDVPARRLEVHTDPQPDGRYRTVHILAENDDVELPHVEKRVRVGSFLP